MILPVFLTLTLPSADCDLLERLFTLYEKRICRFSYQILKNRQDVEDRTMRVFLKMSGNLWFSLLTDEMRVVSQPEMDLLILKYIYNLKSRKIAELLRITPGSVNIRLHRAKRRMRVSGRIQALR